MTQQFLKFDFRKTHNLKDYIVDASNIQAVKWIDKYPNWKNHGLIIEGPKASGKSHLVRLWQKKSNCNIFSSEEVNRELMNVNDKNNIAIEGIEKIKNYEFFLHLINFKKENKLKFLLTSRKSILSQDIYLKDIKSRLLEMPKVLITLPSDNIIKQLLFNLMKDKGLIIEAKLLDFIINRIERSYEGINDFTKKLNRISLEKNKKISISMLKEVLEANQK